MIHDAIINHISEALEIDLIHDLPNDDPALAGVVKIGDLLGDPDPDEARISITIHENDPDVIYGVGITAMDKQWSDEVAFMECGGSVTWLRRFTVKGRALLINTGEDLIQARQIASTIRSRIEKTLLNLSFADIEDDGEYVSKGVMSDQIKGEMVQGGGPPDAFDYYIKIRFQVETTVGVKP